MEDEKDINMEALMASFIFEKEETNNSSGLYKESTTSNGMKYLIDICFFFLV